MNNRSTDVVQRWCMFTTRFSLFKAVLFSAKMRKARERERKSWELGESGRILSSSLFCFVWNAAGGRKEAKKTQKSFLVEKMKRTNFFSIFQFFFFFFCFHFFSRAPREAKILFDFKSRQTNKKTRGGKKNEKKEEKRQKASALHEVFM